jgi:hypothetical protein
LPHEFLLLLCNTEDRIEAIKRGHKPEMVSSKGNMNYWELNNHGKPGTHKVTHIHLLGPTSFVNQSPHIQLVNTLNKEVEDKDFRFIGARPKAEELVSIQSSDSVKRLVKHNHT